MDEMLKQAISSRHYSPFRPAPILANFQMEFNILFIPSFRKYLKTLRPQSLAKVTHDFRYYRSKLLGGMIRYFNKLVGQRHEDHVHLAIRFSRPYMKRANREALLNKDKFFTPTWHITNAKELQMFKRSNGIPDIVEARRDNAIELYVQHDVGSVQNHFYQEESVSHYRKHIQIGKQLTPLNLSFSLASV